MDDVGDRHLEIPGIGHQQQDDDAVERGEIAHHAQNRSLLGARDMGGAHQFGGTAETWSRTPVAVIFRLRLARAEPTPPRRSQGPGPASIGTDSPVSMD